MTFAWGERGGTMEADSVHEVLDALEAASVPVCVDGGWGIDALLGEQTRVHGDLDLIASADAGRDLAAALHAIGFRREQGGSDTNFVLSVEMDSGDDAYEQNDSPTQA